MDTQREISELKFIVCGIVRDAESGLRHNIPVIEQFCKMTGGYEVVIFENDSKDKTKDILHRWAERDSCVHAFCEDGMTLDNRSVELADTYDVNPFYSHKRIGKMVALRNQYMDYVYEHELTADYMIIVDLDVDRIELEGLLSCFNHDDDWDAVTAFGYSFGPKLRKRYHDTFALEEFGMMNIPKTERVINELQDKYRNIKNDTWVRVDSAFGGLAIYRFDAVRGLRYELIDNADKHVPCRCEHTSISFQMKERGYDRVYINPQMRIHYQHLTLKIIWNSLFRRIKSTIDKKRILFVIHTPPPRSRGGNDG